jgi:molybdate transport system regulatory protein
MKKEIRIRCWIDINGERFFGPGPAELLQLVEETGSITNAAKRMGMSYKKAWGLITNMNTKSPSPLVISHKGGTNRGGAEVTPAGKKVMTAYVKLFKQLDAVVKKNSAILHLI